MEINQVYKLGLKIMTVGEIVANALVLDSEETKS